MKQRYKVIMYDDASTGPGGFRYFMTKEAADRFVRMYNDTLRGKCTACEPKLVDMNEEENARATTRC